MQLSVVLAKLHRSYRSQTWSPHSEDLGERCTRLGASAFDHFRLALQAAGDLAPLSDEDQAVIMRVACDDAWVLGQWKADTGYSSFPYGWVARNAEGTFLLVYVVNRCPARILLRRQAWQIGPKRGLGVLSGEE